MQSDNSAEISDGLWPMARLEAALADPERLWDETAQRLLMGEALPKIARVRGFPVVKFCRWVEEDAGRFEEYGRCLRLAASILAHETIEIADTQEMGEVVTEKGDGSVEVKRADMLGHRKLRTEQRQWLASKLDRATFGDSITVKQEREVTLNLRFGQMPEQLERAAIEADRVEDAEVVGEPEPSEQLPTHGLI